MTASGSGLYLGSVMHSRLRPFRHRFRYSAFWLLLDLDELTLLDGTLRLLGIDRPGLLSFRQRDHGPGDGRPLRPWVDELLLRHGIAPGGGRVRLLCSPRVLGYTFNPLCIYYCEDARGRLQAVIYQVNNTFGERHFYVHAVAPDAAPGPLRHDSAKAFYVSPFIAMQATYHFRIAQPSESIRVLIRQSVPEGDQLIATMSGQRRVLRDRELALLALTMPLAGFKVIAAIHWQALKLWLKGARYHPRPVADRQVSP